ncbi:MAG TPA: protein-disulfide reductase DsbD domain-containing protein, partial [Thermoanaerobaculia bacterium]|nr:protein-disulfide reductase DsbD domain-containing protein [Thermoanaerobaculia bacterium]
PEGAFWSAIDAETHGHEGAFYVWTRDELFEALGREDAAFLAPVLGFDGPAFFEEDQYVLHLPERIEQAAERRRMDPQELLHEVKAIEERLFIARARRERPLTDDKILADWNGMVIAGLAVAGRLLGDSLLVDRAAAAARFVYSRMRTPEGLLLHSWRAGQGRIPAYLDDYVFLVRGLLALHEAQGHESWLRSAVELTREQMRRLRDPEGGFFVAAESPDLLFRSKDVFDGATPAGNAVAVLNLLDLAERTGDHSWRSEARASLQAFGAMIQGAPDGARMMSIAARRFHRLEMGGTGEEPAEEVAAFERSAGASGVEKLARAAAGLVTARLAEPVSGDGWQPFRLVLEIAPGWHIQANPVSEEFLLPTEVVAEDGAEVRNLGYPQGEEIPAAFSDGRPLAVYTGRVEVAGEVSGHGRLVVRFQLCDDARCLPPAEQVVAV